MDTASNTSAADTFLCLPGVANSLLLASQGTLDELARQPKCTLSLAIAQETYRECGTLWTDYVDRNGFAVGRRLAE